MNLWGLYWRYLFSIILVLLLLAFLFEHIDLVNTMAYTDLKPSITWAMLSVFLTIVTLFQNKGFVYLFGGRRVRLNIRGWRRFNTVVILMFIALTILGYVVNQLVNTQTWGLYKLYVQPSVLLLFPLSAAWYVTRRTSESS